MGGVGGCYGCRKKNKKGIRSHTPMHRHQNPSRQTCYTLQVDVEFDFFFTFRFKNILKSCTYKFNRSECVDIDKEDEYKFICNKCHYI